MDPNSPAPTSAIETETNQTPSSGTTQKPTRNPKRVLIIASALAGVTLLFILIYVLVFGPTNAALKVSDSFVSDIQKKDAAHAYSISSTAFKDSITELELESTFVSISPALQGSYRDTARKLGTKNDKEFASVVYTIKTKDGDKYVRVDMQKIDDAWQITDFESSSKKLQTTTN